MMRPIRFGLATARPTTATIDSSTGMTNSLSFTPEKNSAASMIRNRIMPVPRSLPASTEPITSADTGTIGTNTCFQFVSSPRLRYRITPSQTTNASLRNSAGCIVYPATRIQLRLPPVS